MGCTSPCSHMPWQARRFISSCASAFLKLDVGTDHLSSPGPLQTDLPLYFAPFLNLLNLPAHSSCTRMATSFRPLPFLPLPIAYSADRLAQLLAKCSLDCAGDNAL